SMGIGAAIGRPDAPVVVLVGDGGLSMALGEIGTAVQEGLNLLVVLFNDRGYGILRNMQDAGWEGRRFASDLLMPDFVNMARSFGATATRVEAAGLLGSCLEEALARSGVSLIEIDLDTIGPMTTPFTGTGRLVPRRPTAPTDGLSIRR